MDIQTTVICTNAVAVNLRELSRRLGKTHLAGMFIRPVSTTGQLPATHFISSGLIPPAYLNAMTDPARLFAVAKKAWEDDGNVFPFTLTQVTSQLAGCTVSNGTRAVVIDGLPVTVNEGPHELLARLGLRLVEP